MAISEEIGKAITAHGQWKQKLRSAIDTGTSESTPERVRKDNNCSFGKWLHDRIDENDKSSPHYLEAVKLHAKVHVEAASVLKLALAGRTAEALQGVALNSEFSKISGKLTKEMKTWQRSLH